MLYNRSISTIQENGKRITLFSLTIPLLLSQIFSLLYGTVNTLILSGKSQEAVSAIGVATQVSNLTVVILDIVAKGAVIVTSVAMGAKDRRRASSVAGTGAILSICFSATAAVLLNLFSVQLMGIMGLTGQVRDMASRYLAVVGATLPITALMSYTNNLLICHGHSRITMLSGMLSNITNVLLCYVALYCGFELPVGDTTAVAFCSAISQIMALTVSMTFFFRKKCLFSFVFRKKEAWDIVRFGAPAGMSLVSYNLSTTVTTGFITGLGVAVINTKLYVTNILSYTSRFSVSLGNAGGILMGRHRGAGRVDSVKKLFRQNLVLAIGCNMTLALLALLFHKPLLSIFTSDPKVIAAAGGIMLIDLAVELPRAINHICEYAFNANGEVKTPLLVSGVSAWACSVLLSFVFAVVLDWGLVGLWLAMIADESFRATVYLLRWRTGKWQNVRV